jgi:hypothetical protein
MVTTRPVALWRSIGTVLIVLAVYAGGIGALAFWPLLLVWWPGLLAGVTGVAALSGAWWLWWRLPKWQVDHFGFTIHDRAAAEDNFRKTIGQLLGGAAVLVGAGFAYLQFQQQQTAAHDLLISNQVAKGFELLGNRYNQIQQRLGGIYALEGVMNTSPQYYRPVLEALNAFVRDETKAKTGDEPPASDVQAALTVIGRRAAGEGSSDLRNAHLPKADLSGVHLGGAKLNGADLSGATLAGADLQKADLQKADLREADLSGGHLNGGHLSGATLAGADLSNADLNEATGLTQAQLDTACGKDVKLDQPLTFNNRPCPK